MIRYQFGITMMTILVLLLTAASLTGYARVLVIVRKRGTPPVFKDTRQLRLWRIIITVSLSALYLIKLYLDMLGPR
ncbi:MAG: hypothetical protein D6800_05685 [Candidatus Zixiibacteriota bacterium]|nr:MAG: hypothetical protein D6800_05685 [candidate division Zixibacteria bacterium]